VWAEALDGRRLTLGMVGINNQNFVLRDRETGSWWQQATGEAFLGPLRGRRLRLIPADEIAFSVWRREHPRGRVLRPADDPTWRRWSDGWEAKTARLPAPGAASAAARSPLPPRAVVLGVEHGAASRAWPVDLLRRQPAVMDDLAGLGVVILSAEDGRSLRVFESTVDGRRVPFFARFGSAAGAGAPVPRRWIDGVTGSEWDFQGRAVAGLWQGRQLRQLPAIQDYWFDWRRYHPATTLYSGGGAG
jgi:hypothetical protein